MIESLKEFILSCNERVNDDTFSVKDEFNNLSLDEQSSIVGSINSARTTSYEFDSLPEEMQRRIISNYEPGRSERIKKTMYDRLQIASRINVLAEVMRQGSFDEGTAEPFELSISAAKYKMEENLRNLLDGITNIDEAEKITFGFTGKFNKPAEGESETFIDVYEGSNVTISNINGACYIDGHEVIVDQKSGYAEISYEDNSLRNKFLNELERSYFQCCAEEGLLSIDQMIGRGMISQVADSMTEGQAFELMPVSKLISVFEDQSSFLHFAIKKMSIRQLSQFIDNIPYDLKEQYLNLNDREGRKVVDLVANEPDKVQLIREAMRERNSNVVVNIDNGGQSVHTASVHKTADQSFVKLAKHSINIEYTTDNDGATINLDHNQAKSVVEKNINNLKKRLNIMKRYSDSELFEYIKQDLDEAQKKLNVDNPEIVKILAFRRFQISKAIELIDDVIYRGHIGDKGFSVDVNIANSNGLTVKEMIALCYNAISQTDKLLVGNKLDKNGQVVSKKYTELENSQEKEEFLKTTEFKFINGLYGIRRGYNIDRNEDRPEEYEYKVNDDINVCPGGVINRLAQSLSSSHEDIEVIIANPELLKLKFFKDVPRIVNQIIEDIPEDQKKILAFQLNEWKKSNKMPSALNGKIIEILRAEISKEGNEIMEDFGRFFSKENIIHHCGGGLMNFSYPHGKITEIKLGVNEEITIEGSITANILDSLPAYTRDIQANHQLTIEKIVQEQPALMISLLNDYSFKLKSSYVLRDGKLIPLVIDWSRSHGEMLLNEPEATQQLFSSFPEFGKPLLDKFPELMFHLLKKDSFDPVENHSKELLVKDWLKNNIRMLIGREEMEQALKIAPAEFKDFFMTLSDEDFRRCENSILNAASNGSGNPEVIKIIPKSHWDDFRKSFSHILPAFTINGNSEGVKALLDIGIDPDMRVQYANQDHPSSTALYSASSSNAPASNEVVKMLLDVGANINIAKYNGNTAISLARRQKNAEKLKMLEEYSRNPVDYLLKSHENNPVNFISAIARLQKNGYNFDQDQSPDRFWDLDSEKVTIFLNKEVVNGETTNFRKIIKAGNKEMFEVALSFKPNITAKDKEMISKFYPESTIPNQESSKNKSWVRRVTDENVRNNSGPNKNNQLV